MVSREAIERLQRYYLQTMFERLQRLETYIAEVLEVANHSMTALMILNHVTTQDKLCSLIDLYVQHGNIDILLGFDKEYRLMYGLVSSAYDRVLLERNNVV